MMADTATVPKPAKQYPAGQTPQTDPLTGRARLTTHSPHSTTSATGPDRTAPSGRRVGEGAQ